MAGPSNERTLSASPWSRAVTRSGGSTTTLPSGISAEKSLEATWATTRQLVDESTLACHCGGRTDAEQPIRAEALAHAAYQKGHVGALSPAVGVQLV